MPGGITVGRRTGRVALTACAVAAGVVVAPGAAAAGPGPTGPSALMTASATVVAAPPSRPRYPAVEDLHEPGVVTRRAYVNRRFTPRLTPSLRARKVGGKLGLLTEDRTTEVVIVLERTADDDGRTWLRIRTPTRPNGTIGWVPADALGTMHRVATWLKIDLGRTRLTLERAGKIVFTARIGVGERRYPTPKGEFYVRNALSGRKLGKIYGPYAFGLSAHSDVLTDWPGGGVIGIHGTNQPGLIPGRVSHGCIRLRNADVRRLARLLPVGTPVTIS